jgi:hypothetical protein
LPALADWRAGQKPALRALLGAAACVVILVGLSSAMFGLRGSWTAWNERIANHATDPSTNNVGLRNVLAFDSKFSAERLIADHVPAPQDEWVRRQRSTFAAHRPLFYALLVMATALALLACRGRRLEQVALIGLLLVPFYFYPSNYYCHFIFLLPLVAVGPQGERDASFAWGFIILAAMCVGQYFTLHGEWLDLRYTYQSLLLLAGLVVMLVQLAWSSLKRAPLGTPSAA